MNRGVHSIRHLWGLFKKEFSLQSVSVLSTVSRLFVGPMVSLLISGLLYSSFFRTSPNTLLGQLNRDNFVEYVALGFLIHTCLNAGYFGFCSRLTTEATSKTLSVLWIAPTSRWLTLGSLAGMECLRIGVIFLLLVAIAGLPAVEGARQIAGLIAWLFALGGVALLMGALRACLLISVRGVAEFVDQLYLLTVFTVCPYIPRELLPGPLQAVCNLNPLFHLSLVGRALWAGEAAPQLPLTVSGAYLVTMVVCSWWIWRQCKWIVLEKSFAG